MPSILGILDNLGGAMQRTGVAMAAPVTRTAATAVRAGRGAVALAGAGGAYLAGDRAGASRLMAEEGRRQQAEGAGPQEHRPVNTLRETLGVGAQLGIIFAAPGAAAFGAPSALSGAVLGGSAGLVAGAGKGLEDAGATGAGVVETIDRTAMGGIKGAVVGGALATPCPVLEPQQRRVRNLGMI